MTVYVPILKAKEGEFEAYSRLAPAVTAGVTPIFEFCPSADLDKDITNAVKKACKLLPPSARVAIDTGHVSQSTVRRPGLQNKTVPEFIADALLSKGITVMPVCSSDNPQAAAHLMSVMGQSGWTVLRVRAAAFVTTTQAGSHLRQAAAAVGLPDSKIHLLLDYGALRDGAQVSLTAEHARRLIGAAQGAGSWASITVGAGSFPEGISALQAGAPNRITRLDAQFYRHVVSRGDPVNYADYVVNGPELPGMGQRAPLPNLRYLDGRDWVIWRERRNRPGNESFFDLSKRAIADSSFAGPAYSWGDTQIEAAAREIIGTGNATKWRAYGTNHHVTAVVDRLATLGEP